MSEFTDDEKRIMATKAHIDAGVLTLFEAFELMHVMQKQINNVIDKIIEVEKRLGKLA